jgi:hypothetical protein
MDQWPSGSHGKKILVVFILIKYIINNKNQLKYNYCIALMDLLSIGCMQGIEGSDPGLTARPMTPVMIPVLMAVIRNGDPKASSDTESGFRPFFRCPICMNDKLTTIK